MFGIFLSKEKAFMFGPIWRREKRTCVQNALNFDSIDSSVKLDRYNALDLVDASLFCSD